MDRRAHFSFTRHSQEVGIVPKRGTMRVEKETVTSGGDWERRRDIQPRRWG
jgi:hypothetical protein